MVDGKVGRLFREAKKNGEFVADIIEADPRMRPTFHKLWFVPVEEQIGVAFAYLGWMIAKGRYNEIKNK